MKTRTLILQLVKEEGGQWISGEKICTSLNISRSAVSKHIHSLRRGGYNIESATKKGYRYISGSEMVTALELEPLLETQIFGRKKIVHFQVINSTNSYAKELARKGAIEGTLVISESQSQGRGRRERRWFSKESKNLLVSIILRPSIAVVEASFITLLSAVAITEVLRENCGIKPFIKWPNDIMTTNNRKIAGILTEMQAGMDVIDFVIVGFGLNVNTMLTDFEPEIEDRATSLLVETQKEFSRKDILSKILLRIEEYYLLVQKRGFDIIIKKYCDLSEIIGKRAKVELVGRTHRGKVMSITPDGFLLLENEEGELVRLFSGDLTLL